MTQSEFLARVGKEDIDLQGQTLYLRGNKLVLDGGGHTILNGTLYIVGSGNRFRHTKLVSTTVRVEGTQNSIRNCTFACNEHKSSESVWMYGGNIFDLTQCLNTLSDCTFYGTSGGQGTVVLNGCGMRVKRNKFFGQSNPTPAIKLVGSLHDVTRNEISYHCVVGKSLDAGAISIGRILSWVNNRITYNTIRMLNLPDIPQGDTVGIYIDDCASLQLVFSNVIEGFPRGIMQGGGSYNAYVNNTLVNCQIGIRCDARGCTWAKLSATEGEIRNSLESIPRESKLWNTFRELSAWNEVPTNVTVAENTFVNVTNPIELIESSFYTLTTWSNKEQKTEV